MSQELRCVISDLCQQVRDRDSRIEQLEAALKVCADQFELYAQYHKMKMDQAQHKAPAEYWISKEKMENNQLLAINARKALEGIEK